MKKLITLMLCLLLVLCSVLVISCNKGGDDDGDSNGGNQNGGNQGGGSDGSSYTVTFNPDNGEATFTQTVAAGETLQRPTNPTKANYEFAGWYNGDKLWNFNNEVTESMTLVAKWQYNVVTIEYDPGMGMLEDDEWEIGVEKDTRFTNHPTPTHSNPAMLFSGWFLDEACTIQVGTAYKFSENTTLYAKWIQQVQCQDGTYNHAYGSYYTYSDPTCTEAGVTARDCLICSITLKIDDVNLPALGHDYTAPNEAGFGYVKECKRSGCGDKKYVDFTNITQDTLGNNPSTTVQLTQGSGTLYGEDKIACVVNGSWDEQNSGVFCGKGSAIEITITLAEPSSMNRIYVKGRGSASFDILVKYQGDSEFVRVGGGAFLNDTQNSKPMDERTIPFAIVDGTKVVEKVQIYMATPSNGMDYWEEVGFFKTDAVEDDGNSGSQSGPVIGGTTNGKVTISYDPGQGMLGDNEWEIKVVAGERFTDHPTPVHPTPGLAFDGWYFDRACTQPVPNSYVYEGHITLYAKWTQMLECSDGTYNHSWGGYYVYSDATCTEDGVIARDCMVCGITSRQTDSSSPALGHSYGPAVEAGFGKVESCTTPGCDEKKITNFQNVTNEALGKNPGSQVSIVEGAAWGAPSCIVDGQWDSGSTMAGKQGKLSVELALAEPTIIDRIYVKGRGSVDFEIYVQYDGDNTFTLVGNGTFLSDEENAKDESERQIPYAEVDATRAIRKVRIVMPNSSNGMDQWQEVGFFRLPEEE